MNTEYIYAINNEVSKKEYFSSKEGIRVLKSENKFKVIVAREVSRYLSSVSRHWDTLFRKDVNSEALADHLNRAFPELSDGWEFRTLPSQHPFDIVSLGLNLVIEVKSVRAGMKDIISNATVYPDRVRAMDALPGSFEYPDTSQLFKTNSFNASNTYLDVLVACITHEDDVVKDYAIVDGNYWGITEEIYLGCKDYFADINSYVAEINRVLAEETENAFAEILAEGGLGDAIDFKLRKLITLTNPVGRLGVNGRIAMPK